MEICIQSKKKLNERQLNKEKFELIKEIRSNWDIDEFLKGSLTNYKLMASVYKILEESVRKDLEIDPKELYQAKNFILEHLSNNTRSIVESTEKDALIKIYEEQSKEMRLLSYKIMVDNFNKKYSVLNESQQNLIKQYIYNVSNTNSLKSFITEEVPKVKSELISLSETISEPVLKIKVRETAKQLDKICEGNTVKDSHVSSLLIAYELIKELSNGK
jgi:DNA mismatch repair ATPase MutS